MEKITDHHLNRIVSQHKVRPKFMGWLAAINSFVEDTMNLYRSLDQAFDLETATGAQLDIIGKIVGVSRLLNFEPMYSEPLLSDEYYRMVIKAKISLNHWDGTTEGILSIWDGIMGGYTLQVIDHQDMTMTMRILNMSNLFEAEFISRGYLAPKPSTVGVRYEFSMYWETSSDFFIAGGVVDERVTYWLNDLLGKDVNTGMELYSGGGVSAEITIYHLANASVLPELCTGQYFAAGIVASYSTRTWLAGDGRT